jgi:hypothetical protein
VPDLPMYPTARLTLYEGTKDSSRQNARLRERERDLGCDSDYQVREFPLEKLVKGKRRNCDISAIHCLDVHLHYHFADTFFESSSGS